MPRHVQPTPFVIHPPDDLARRRPDLRTLSAQLSSKYADRQVVTEENLLTVGHALWNALGHGVHAEFDAAHTAAGAEILSVIVESDAADVQTLPWEVLYHPALGFVGKHPGLTLARRTGRIKAPPPGTTPLDKGPLRVLLFTSLPDDVDPETGRLNVEEEQAQVQEALMQWIAKGLVHLEMPDDGRVSTLREWLDSFHPHLLFLSGHGRFHHQPHTGEAPYGEFLFESESGESDPVREDQIAAALIGMGVQAVVLSACESSKASSESLNNGLTRRISAQGIPHVIGMRESILDRAGIQFARALCDELARGERIDTALQTARIAIQTPLKDGGGGESSLGAAEELSLGQWCLPILLSSDPQRPLIDWDFPPREVEARILNRRLDSVSLPARFVGRRAEMRRYKSRVLKGGIRKMLITGPGGQGKTSLAGKLALDLQRQGYRVFAWSARPENPWRRFVREMSLSLTGYFAERYDRALPGFENEKEHAEKLLGLLTEQYHDRVLCFLDNLEAIQDPDTLEINDGTVAVWLDAARNTQGVILLATSRWQLPGWNGEHLMLSLANYGDFLQMAQQLAARGQLRRSLLEKRPRLRHVYGVLGGNSRGLELFAAATLDIESPEEEALLQRLAATKRDLQANMAIEAIYARLPETAKTLLARLPAYYEPVPAEGMIKLGIDLPEDPQPLLERLLAVSLLEAQYEADWDVIQYQCGPLVTDWLRQQNLIDPDPGWLNAAADYHLYLLKYERRGLTQSIITHGALRRAGRHAEADRLTLDAIVGPLTTGGFYATLLTEWLPRICDSPNPKTRGEALGQTGKLLLHVGDYAKALTYMKQSLAIRQQIGDKAGEGATLNNISQVFKAQGDYETALGYLKQSLAVSQQIGDKAGEGTTLNNISQIYHARGDYETALSCLKQSLAIRQQIGDKAGEGTTLNNISQIYAARGDYETALSYLKQSLAIWQHIGDKAGEGATLNNISILYHAQGDYETALSYLKQSLAIRQQIGDKAGEGTALNNISQIYDARGDYETALSYLEQSLAIRQQIGDKAGEGTTLNNIAAIYHAQGDYETALSCLKQSLAISQQIGDKAGEGTTLNNISQIYDARGDYETALSCLKQSLAIRQQIGDKAGEGTTLNNISQVFKAQGDYETALSHLKQSRAISQQIGDKAGEGAALNNISILYHAQGDYETALSYLKQSLAISQQIGDKAGEGTTLNNISQIYDARGDYETALSYLEQSLAISQQIGDKAGLCTTLFNMGHIHIQNGQTQEAVAAWVKAYMIAKPMNLAQVLQALANLAPQLGLPAGLEGWERLAQQFQIGAVEGNN